jgi:hypothetical protein
MSNLKPFILKSLREMREELVGMNKSDLTFKTLNDLLPKYRSGLAGSGVYNRVSNMMSAHQYAEDIDLLNAVRFDTVAMVDEAIVAVDGEQAVQPILEQYIPRVTDTKVANLLSEFNAIKDRAPNLAAIGFRTILSHLIQEQAKAANPDHKFSKQEDLAPKEAIDYAVKEDWYPEAERKLIRNFQQNGQKDIFDNITHKPGAKTLISKDDLSAAVDTLLNRLLPVTYPKGDT